MSSETTILLQYTVNPDYNDALGTGNWLRCKRYFVKSGYDLLSMHCCGDQETL